MPVTHINAAGEWAKMLAAPENKNKLIVVDFFADWCGPCKFIAPKIEAMSAEFTDVLFAKVDVDNLADIAEECGITAMPTFQLYKDGKKVTEFTGADESQLRTLVSQHSGA